MPFIYGIRSLTLAALAEVAETGDAGRLVLWAWYVPRGLRYILAPLADHDLAVVVADALGQPPPRRGQGANPQTLEAVVVETSEALGYHYGYTPEEAGRLDMKVALFFLRCAAAREAAELHRKVRLAGGKPSFSEPRVPTFGGRTEARQDASPEAKLAVLKAMAALADVSDAERRRPN